MLRGGRAFIFRRNERSTSPGMGVHLRRNTQMALTSRIGSTLIDEPFLG